MVFNWQINPPAYLFQLNQEILFHHSVHNCKHAIFNISSFSTSCIQNINLWIRKMLSPKIVLTDNVYTHTQIKGLWEKRALWMAENSSSRDSSPQNSSAKKIHPASAPVCTVWVVCLSLFDLKDEDTNTRVVKKQTRIHQTGKYRSEPRTDKQPNQAESVTKSVSVWALQLA